jgi:hypothetical protein
MTTMSTTQITQPTEKIRLAKYHLIVLTFFIFTLFANYAAVAQYLRFFPEEYQKLGKAVILFLFAVQSGFLISAIPLGVVFIFGWLYLMDVKVNVKRLYQIVVISTLPVLLLMVGLTLRVTFFVELDPAMAARLSELSQATMQDVKQNVPNSPHAAELAELMKVQQEKVAGPAVSMKLPLLGKVVEFRRQQAYLYVAVILSCLLCGYLLHQRLKLKTLMAMLIPLTFVGSVFILRTVVAVGSSPLTDSLKGLLKQQP